MRTLTWTLFETSHGPTSNKILRYMCTK